MRDKRDEFSGYDDFAASGDDFKQASDQEFQEERAPKRQEHQEEEMIPKSRFDEVVNQRNNAETERQAMIRAMLDRSNQPQQTAAQEPEIPPGVDEEVATAVTPLLEHRLSRERQMMTEEINQQMEARYGRVLKEAERESNLREMERRVPGFQRMLPQIQEHWNRLSPQEQQEYGTSPAAMEGFVRRVMPGSTPIPVGTTWRSARHSATRRLKVPNCRQTTSGTMTTCSTE